jgi:hypothetical protein
MPAAPTEYARRILAKGQLGLRFEKRFASLFTFTSVAVGPVLFSINHLDEILRGQGRCHLLDTFRCFELGHPHCHSAAAGSQAIARRMLLLWTPR